MSDPKELTREDVLRAAGTFRWTKKMPKWTVIVQGLELPARPLILRAAGVAPNDPTNSHQAVAILHNLGFETRYSESSFERRTIVSDNAVGSSDALEEIAAAVGEIAGRIPEAAWDLAPSDLAKNVDHYLYGTKEEK